MGNEITEWLGPEEAESAIAELDPSARWDNREGATPLEDFRHGIELAIKNTGRPRTAAEENRVKIISLDERLLIDVLSWWRDPPHWLALPIIDALPPDCVVVRVAANFEGRCLDVMIASNEFPVLPPGCYAERIPGIIDELRTVPFSELAARHRE